MITYKNKNSVIIYNIPKIQQGCCISNNTVYEIKTRIPYITISIAVAKIKNKTNKKKKKEWKNFLLLVSETIKVYSRSVVSYV